MELDDVDLGGIVLEVDHDLLAVKVDGRQVLVRWYPVSIDPVALRAIRDEHRSNGPEPVP